MAKNINQVYMTNPITSNASTDLMYFGQSPYTTGDDAAMTFSNFAAQFGAPYAQAALTSGDDTNVTLTLGGTPNTALLHAASITAGWTGELSSARGGTGINNGASTFTIGGDFQMSGSFTFNGTLTGDTAVTFPTSGTLATVAQIPTGAPLSVVEDTNVTLTLGGSPLIALVNAASITAGWSGELSLARGGTNASLAASDGGIFYSTASAGAILAGTATANQVLISGANSAPSWSTATFPTAAGAAGTVLRSDGTGWVASTATFADTYVTNSILYSNGANTVTGLAPSASAVLVTTSASDIEWTSALTDGQLIVGSTGATPSVATLTAGTNISITNGAGSITINATAAAGITNVDQNTSSVTMTANDRYIIDNGASLVTLTLPASQTIGDTYIIVGGSSGGWTVAQDTGQQCHIGNVATTSGTGGSFSSSNRYDCVTITCIGTNTFSVYGMQGNITVV